MRLELEFCDVLCDCAIFTINGIDADYGDFGQKYDDDPDSAEEYGCGDMRFVGQVSTLEVLLLYGISQDEYDEIVGKLEDGLSFGRCGWCV